MPAPPPRAPLAYGWDHRDFRNPLSLFANKWIRAVAALPPWEAPVTPIRTPADVMHWVHHDTPLVHSPLLVDMSQQMRQAALAFHSQVLHERYITGRSSHAPHDDPEYLVPLDQAGAPPLGRLGGERTRAHANVTREF